MTVRGGLDWDIEVRLKGLDDLKAFQALVRDIKTDISGLRTANLSGKATTDAAKLRREQTLAAAESRKQQAAENKEIREANKAREKAAKEREKQRSAATRAFDKDVKDRERARKKEEADLARAETAEFKRIQRRNKEQNRRSKAFKDFDEAKRTKDLKAQKKAVDNLVKAEKRRRDEAERRDTKRFTDAQANRKRTAKALAAERKERERLAEVQRRATPQFAAQQRIQSARKSLQTERILADSKEFQNIQKSLADIRANGPKAAKSLDRARRNAQGLASQFSRLIKVVLVLEGIRFAVQTIGTAFSASIRRAADLEQATLGIASVITATANAASVFGRLEGAAALTAGLTEAEDQLEQLRLEAIRTAATFEDLAFAFQTALGPGLAAGLNIDEVRQFSVRIAQAAAAIGLEQNQLAEEIRSILQGTISRRTTRIATVLNIDNEDIRRVREMGTLAEFLEDRFAAFGVAADKSLRNFNVLLVNAQDALKNLGAESLAPVFDELKGLFEDIIKTVTSAELGEGFEVDPSVVANFRRVGDAVAQTVKSVRDLIKNLNASDFDTIIEAIEGIASGFDAVLLPSIQGILTASQLLLEVLNPIIRGFVAFANTFPVLVKLTFAFGILTRAAALFGVTLGGIKTALGLFQAQLAVVQGQLATVGLGMTALVPPILAAVAAIGALYAAYKLIESVSAPDESSIEEARVLRQQSVEYDRLSRSLERAMSRLNRMPAAFRAQLEVLDDASKAVEEYGKQAEELTLNNQIEAGTSGLEGAVAEIVSAQIKIAQDLTKQQQALDKAVVEINKSAIQSARAEKDASDKFVELAERSEIGSARDFLTGQNEALQDAVKLQRELIKLEEDLIGLQAVANSEKSRQVSTNEELERAAREIEKVEKRRNALALQRNSILRNIALDAVPSVAGKPTTPGLTQEQLNVQTELQADLATALSDIVKAQADQAAGGEALLDIDETRLKVLEALAKLERDQVTAGAGRARRSAQADLNELQDRLASQRGAADEALNEGTPLGDSIRINNRERQREVKLEKELAGIDRDRFAIRAQISRIEGSGSIILQQSLPALNELLSTLDQQKSIQEKIILSVEQEFEARRENLRLAREAEAAAQSAQFDFDSRSIQLDSNEQVKLLELQIRRAQLQDAAIPRQQKQLELLQLEAEQVQTVAKFEEMRILTAQEANRVEAEAAGINSERAQELLRQNELLELRLTSLKRILGVELELNEQDTKAAKDDGFDAGAGAAAQELQQTSEERGRAFAVGVRNSIQGTLSQAFADIFDPNVSDPLRNALTNLTAGLSQAFIESFTSGLADNIIGSIFPGDTKAKGGIIGFDKGGAGDMTMGGHATSNSIPLPKAPAGADPRDKHLAVMRKGEYVLTPPMVRALGGYGILERLRMGRGTLMKTLGSLPNFASPRTSLGRGRVSPLQQFRDGGIVGAIKREATGVPGIAAAASQPATQPVLVVTDEMRRQIVTEDLIMEINSSRASELRGIVQS